jgi:hypothetical protein
MTALTDSKALAPNAAGKASFQTKGVDEAALVLLIQQHALELNILVKQMISLHPASGDSTTLTALSNLLSELA